MTYVNLNENYITIIYIGTSSELRSSIKVTNPTYDTIIDDHSKKPVEQPIGYYAEVIIPTQVKMTPNPAYAVPTKVKMTPNPAYAVP